MRNHGFGITFAVASVCSVAETDRSPGPLLVTVTKSEAPDRSLVQCGLVFTARPPCAYASTTEWSTSSRRRIDGAAGGGGAACTAPADQEGVAAQ